MTAIGDDKWLIYIAATRPVDAKELANLAMDNSKRY